MAIGVQVWSNSPASNASADTNINWLEGMAPSAMNDSARSMMASVAKFRDDNNGTIATSGTTSAFTAVTNQIEGSLTAGYTVTVQMHATNETAATLAVDGLAAAPMQTAAGIPVRLGQFPAGSIQRFTYSSTGTGQWIVNGRNALSTVTAFSSAITAFTTSAFTDSAASASLGTTGIWLVTASVVVQTAVAAAGGSVGFKLWDGTTIMNTGYLSTPAAGYPCQATLSGVIANPAANVRLSCQGLTGGGATYAMRGTDGLFATSADQNIIAVRIG